ncbi:MAG: glycosyltransferase [Chitinophagaceae bacterium]
MPKTILHITDVLTVGGTEVLLAGTVPELSEYRHIVVYLKGENKFEEALKGIPVICLHHSGKFSLFRTAKRLRKIIKTFKVDTIHAHLIWSRFVAALAKTSRIRMIASVHSVISKDAFEKNKLSRWMEKYTAKKVDDLICVSQFVLDDYTKYIPFKGRTHLLHNFIPDLFFNTVPQNNFEFNTGKTIRCIAIGSLKEAKNYAYTLQAFSLLPGKQFSLDIVGNGPLKEKLQLIIDEKKLPVQLLGGRQDIPTLLKNYDVFIQSSLHEGFGIAAAEAIAGGLIPVLSDIPAHKEITNRLATFFSTENPNSLANALKGLLDKPIDMQRLQELRKYIRSIAGKDNYLTKLKKIYDL